MTMGIIICMIIASVTFAIRIATDSSIKAFTILFLTLGFFTVTNSLLREVFTSVFSDTSHILHLFII